MFVNHSIQYNSFVLQTATQTTGHTTRCRLYLRQHFFCERVVDCCNGLDQCVTDSATVNVNSFKNGLRRILQSQTLSSFRRHRKTHYLQSVYPVPRPSSVHLGSLNVRLSSSRACHELERSGFREVLPIFWILGAFPC